MLTPLHVRAAMALLDINRTKMAEIVNVEKQTISAFLHGSRNIGSRTLYNIEAYFKEKGVVFLEEGDASTSGGIGIRLKT